MPVDIITARSTALNSYPLVIDLDGTLIDTDTLHESALKLLRSNVTQALQIPLWLAKGKAVLKEKIAERATIDPASLPYNAELLAWLHEERATGRKIVLCTAADVSIAESIAEHLGIFSEVIASNGVVNLEGTKKASELEKRFGRKGFDYAGNSRADLAVWKVARSAIVVNASEALVRQARTLCEVTNVIPKKRFGIKVWLKMLRVHQWLKSALLFVPLFAAHDFFDMHAWQSLALAFFAFSLCASSVYIANDLLDLESDRLHPRKCKRPFASGALPISTGVFLAPILLVTSLAIGHFVDGAFWIWLLVYFILTCAYSLFLKKVVLIDCMALALLYTLRIIAGAAAVGQTLSFWLLAFAIFLFLSLAFVKRYAELEMQLLRGKEKLHGRGYHTDDAPLIQSMGIVSGYTSVLVLALYLNSEAVVKLYHAPEWIWVDVPVMLFWISWMWMQAHRGNMHDDPLVFAVKDLASVVTGAIFIAILYVGAVGGISWLQ